MTMEFSHDLHPLTPLQRQQFHQKELLDMGARLLSRLDRCPLTASSGSFDREYWAWATKDFANMDLQRGVRVLVFLHQRHFPGNFYFQSPALAEWIQMAIQFWIQRQERSGAFDHLYLHENSWMAAAFTLLDMASVRHWPTLLANTSLAQAWVDTARCAADHLQSHDETHGFISNHRAAAAAALAAAANITGNDAYRTAAWQLMETVYQRQSSEGWYLEYEGADPGYQTLDTHYQALFARETNNDPRTLKSVEHSLLFLSWFLHPDGSIGGEYGSRGCPHFFPGGFEYFSQWLPMAEAIASWGTAGVAGGGSCGLRDADERNEVPLATSHVLAWECLNDRPQTTREIPLLPVQRIGMRFWPEAGLFVRSDTSHFLVFGGSRGGVIKLFHQQTGKLVFGSCGYVAQDASGRSASTLLWTTKPRMHVQRDEPFEVTLHAPFFFFRTNRLMKPWSFWLFRLFNLTVGRNLAFNRFVRKHLIIGRFLKERRPAGVLLKRCLHRMEGRWHISDTIEQTDKQFNPVSMEELGLFSTVYMASAKYFRKQDLQQVWRHPLTASQSQQAGVWTTQQALES
ncbi:MAG: hypothetical protein HW380_2284 [Magnetococcales bacterium]|nr:hypothetical protein [Magnetococcales bacterium]